MSSIRPEITPVFVKPSGSDDFFIAMNRLAANILRIIRNKWLVASLKMKNKDSVINSFVV